MFAMYVYIYIYIHTCTLGCSVYAHRYSNRLVIVKTLEVDCKYGERFLGGQ